MATMVTSTKQLPRPKAGGGSKLPGPNGNSGKGNGHEGPFPRYDSTANRYRIGMWVGLASILMLFTSLTSAYIVRAASSNDWRPLPMPRILLLSTALILISSGTLELAKRKLKATLEGPYKTWLLLTTALGLGFLVSQLFAWRQLVGQGVYVASHPHSSFFYLLTATHGVHLIGGLLALVYLIVRTRQPLSDERFQAKRAAAAGAVAIYWHFMDILWIYLFVLLFFWR
ncbi:MAG TPA: cytochrome c oxidase subunit 3 [Pyrinomonadaceae bacterium]|nr:cytochrome c oxidase subunit 3 [Pyrinomonadaceae bacterium]